MPTDVATHKAQLRAELRALRARIAADPADRRARSDRIWAGIVPLADLGGDPPPDGTDPARIGRRVLLFDGLPTEPDTAAWLEWCRARGVAFHLPAVEGPDLAVVPGRLDPVELDVVVVPGLAFTTDGRRLGQGGGHYDRFLARLRPDCLTIGACFAEQIVPDLPCEPHDVPVGAVVTDAP